MKRAGLIFITLIMLLIPTGAQAQDLVEIDSMQIDIWPEYDQPDVLVIYRFVLSGTTSLPAQLSMRIPAASGGPFNVAIKDTDGLLYTVDYTAEQQGDWIAVNFSAPTAEVQLEYYDPNLTRSGSKRAFTYTWPADYTVHSMSIQIQQPVNASQMQIDPAVGTGQVLQDGLMYFTGMFGEIQAGERFDLNLSYEKPDDVLSAGFEPVSPVAPIDDQAEKSTSFKSVLPWVLGGVGLLLVLGVVVWYLLPQRKQEPVKRKRHTPASRKPAQPGGTNFCHNCGHPAQSGDKFCRSCGARLRT